jgi:hypothetical protein
VVRCSSSNRKFGRLGESLCGRSSLPDALDKIKVGFSKEDQTNLLKAYKEDIQWPLVLEWHDWLCTNSSEAHVLRHEPANFGSGIDGAAGLSDLPGDEQRMLMLQAVMEHGGEHPAIALFKTFQQCSRTFPNYWVENENLQLQTHKYLIGVLGARGNLPRAHYVYNDALSLFQSKSTTLDNLNELTSLHNTMLQAHLISSSTVRSATAFLASSMFSVCPSFDALADIMTILTIAIPSPPPPPFRVACMESHVVPYIQDTVVLDDGSLVYPINREAFEMILSSVRHQVISSCQP